jgi:predicted GNAT family N-acyltransferase
MSVTVARARTAAERADALAVRERVFVDEQGVPMDRERDGRDEGAVHLLAHDTDGDRAVGAARVRAYAVEDGVRVGKLERVAVLPERRGEGLGTRLTREAERVAREEGFDRLRLAAQTHATGFYDRLGYEAVGEVFEDAGIPHRSMVKRL